MIYVASILFDSFSEDGQSDTEGHFSIIADVASEMDMMEVIVPTRLREIEGASELDYVEFYLQGLVELPDLKNKSALVGFAESTLRDCPAYEEYGPLVMKQDEGHSKICKRSEVSVDVPFATIGKKPLRLSKLEEA
jgi:hypothetical protein